MTRSIGHPSASVVTATFGSVEYRTNSAHFGTYEVAQKGDGTLSVRGHPADPDPSPMLANIEASLDERVRIARPAIRRGWLEDGPGPDRRRGVDPFVQVGWDEVLDRLAAELDRVRTDHGNESIYGGTYGWSSPGRLHHAQSQLHRFLNLIGGHVQSVHTYSNGCSAVLLDHVAGSAAEVLRKGTTWAEILDHTELIVAFGGMPLRNTWVSPGGFTRHDSGRFASDVGSAGIEVASITPLRDDAPDSMSASWYPITPGTDTALMLALAQVLDAEDLVDGDFLARYCVGGDRLLAYVRGATDGQPKDPSWAEALTAVPAADITALARRMAERRTLVTVTWSLQRTPFGEQPVWMGLALAALLGQLGLPGGGFGHGYGSMADTGASWLGSASTFPAVRQGVNPVGLTIPVAHIGELLRRPGELYEFDGQTHLHPDIRVVYWAGGNPFHHHQDLNRFRSALAGVDTFVVQDPFWTPSARHADIVLPATTSLERNDIGAGRKDHHLVAMQQVAEPFGQARNDRDILAGLAKRFGVADAFTEGRTEREWLVGFYETWRERLGDRAGDVPDFDTFWANGSIEVPVDPGADRHNLFERFRADPVAHPLKTPSGRLELFSETIDGFGYDDCPGHPVWREPPEWLGSPGSSRHPLHLIANQPATRLHGQLDHGEFSADSKVAGREPVRLHPDDAAARGITDGDLVRIHNDRGACLAGAVLTADVRTGVVQLATGAWYDPDDPASDKPLCLGGNPNVLTADRGTSRLAQGCTGQHTLVEIERYLPEPPPGRAHQPPVFVDPAPAS